MTNETTGRGWIGILIPAVTFVVGILLGGLVIGAGLGSDDTAADGAGSGPAASPSASPSPETVVRIPAACQEAADNLQRATQLLEDSVDSVRNFQTDQIVEALRELQAIDAETRPLVSECRNVDVTMAPTATPSPSPSPSP